MPPPPDDDEVLDTEAAARLLDLSEAKLRQMVWSGQVPARPVRSEGGHRVIFRFSRNLLLAWVRGEPIPPSAFVEQPPSS